MSLMNDNQTTAVSSPPQPQATVEDIQHHRDDLKAHFKEEFRIKTQVNSYEKEIENEKLSL
jgi:hypothetical protein